MLLCLLEQWTYGFGNIGETEVHRLGKPIPIPIELGLFQAKVGRKSIATTRRFNCGNDCGRHTAEESDLPCQDLGMVQFL
jgi:hypothetical protein